MKKKINCKSYVIGMLAGLAVMGCGRSTGNEDLSHDEVRAVNAWVLEKAISQPDSALMMIERLRRGDLTGIDTTGLSVRVNGPLPDYRCDFLRAKVYGQTLEGMWLDSAIIIGERLMTLDAAREDLAYRQDVLEMLIHACRQHRDDEPIYLHNHFRLLEGCGLKDQLSETQRRFIEIMSPMYIAGRYPEYKSQVARMLNEKGSAYLIDETKKFKQWILQKCSPETKPSASSDDTKK